MVVLSSETDTDVVVCRNGIYHIDIHIQSLDQIEAVFNDFTDVIDIMALLIIFVTRKEYEL